MPLQIFYLGPPGTYSHTVALHFAPHPSCATPSGSISGCIQDARAAWSAYGNTSPAEGEEKPIPLALLPYENSTYGPVHETQGILVGEESAGLAQSGQRRGLDLNSYAGRPGTKADAHAVVRGDTSLVIVEEATRPVRHALLGSRRTRDELSRRGKGANDEARSEGSLDLSQITKVLSHEQALGQCSHFLTRICPNAKRVAVASTALGARLAASQSRLGDRRQQGGDGAAETSAEAHRLQTTADSSSTSRANVYTGDAESALASGGSGSRREEQSSSDEAELVVAIGTEQAAEEFDLVVLQRDIQDRDDNETRFLLVAPSNETAEAYRHLRAGQVDLPQRPSRALLLLHTDTHSETLTQLMASVATREGAGDATTSIRKIDRRALPFGLENGRRSQTRRDAVRTYVERGQEKVELEKGWPSAYLVEVESDLCPRDLASRLEEEYSRRPHLEHALEVLGIWQTMSSGYPRKQA